MSGLSSDKGSYRILKGSFRVSGVYKKVNPPILSCRKSKFEQINR